MKSVLLSIVLFLCAGYVQASNWYVTPSGAGSKNGTSWTNAWQGTGIGWGSVSPGDTVWLAAGTYSSGLTDPTVSGSSGSPITVSAVSSTSSIAGSTPSGDISNGTTQQVVVTVGAGGVGMDMSSVSYVNLTGDLWSPPGLPTVYGIKFSIPGSGGGKGINGGTNSSVVDVEFAGPPPNSISPGTYGMNQTTSTTNGIFGGDNLLVSGCKLHDMDTPLQYVSQSCTIEYSTIYNVSSQYQISAGSNPHPDWCYNNQPFTDLTIRYCLVSSVVSEGLFFDNFSGPAAGGTFTNLTMYGCLLFQGDSALAGSDAMEVKTQAGNYGAFYLYNNTFVDWFKGALYSDGPSTGWISALSTVKNNLFVNSDTSFDNGTAPGSPGHIVTAYNGYCGSTKQDSPADTNPITNATNPFDSSVAHPWVSGGSSIPATRASSVPVGYDPTPYLSSFYLASGSWALSAGTTVPAGMNTDMFGNTGSNLGAFQSSAPAPLTPGTLSTTGYSTPQTPGTLNTVQQ